MECRFVGFPRDVQRLFYIAKVSSNLLDIWCHGDVTVALGVIGGGGVDFMKIRELSTDSETPANPWMPMAMPFSWQAYHFHGKHSHMATGLGN